jgi:hypothetical protein
LSDVWVSDTFFGVVYRIDPATDRIMERIKAGRGSPNEDWDCMTEFAGKIWVTNPATKAIYRIDPATDRVDATVHLPYRPSCLTGGYGSVWVGIAGSRFTAARRRR